MSYRDTVLYCAGEEAQKPVHWAAHESRILEYFLISTGQSFTKKEALKVSWCSYFVHWCLWKGGMDPLAAAGTPGTLGKMGSIGRFLKSRGGVYEGYSVQKRNYEPKPGDMYYKPNPNNHIGFISDVRPAGTGRYEIRSIDGNSGPSGYSPYFDMSYGKKIGYGFTYQPDGWRALAVDCWYIQLTDSD